ncbi:hypothetical protein TEA_028431 [Camellia sinensis var. sinensis]|uniref:Wall-associated receptor kinase galacturonan-binding domain-containing protein n=1 Tax=Camellia sinensis var. sinensis TaxID=542762 RepID=A0A4V6RYK8_CAMSN|nr:hypothetical protein TEA_028431 [Camellia sinensis var. sinensis]
MFRGRLLFAAGYISLLVHVIFCVNCCNSSSCGDIHNITFPFRLKSDPVDNCGYKNVKLECENNRTVVYLFSGKYYVQAINYYETGFGTISLVDVGIQRNNCSSLPLHSLTPTKFPKIGGPIDYYIYPESFVALVSCEKPVKSPLYIDTTSNISTAFCENKGGRGGGGEGGVRGSSSSKKHSYVLVGNHSLERLYSLDWSDVANLCSVDMLFPMRLRLPDGRLIERNMTSLLEVHNALADGFDLDWSVNNYEYCRLQAHCYSNHTQNYTAAVCHGLRGFSAFLGLQTSRVELSFAELKLGFFAY